MSQENVNVIRGMYEAFAKGDVPTIIAALDSEVEWREAENFARKSSGCLRRGIATASVRRDKPAGCSE